MLKIAVCDDNDAERQRTSALLEGYLRERTRLDAALYLFENGDALLNAERQGQGFDIYLLDVIMPGHNGIEVGKALRNMGRVGAIIYLTASPDYAVDSYQTRAFFYLLKPVGQEQLFEVLDRASSLVQKQKSEVVIVNTPGGLVSIPIDDILYVERVDRSMRYYLAEGKTVDSRSIRSSFREAAAALLADSRFTLCGASFVLNLHHIKAVERAQVLLDSGGRVSLSRASYADLKKAWMNYWLGGDLRT